LSFTYTFFSATCKHELQEYISLQAFGEDRTIVLVAIAHVFDMVIGNVIIRLKNGIAQSAIPPCVGNISIQI
jgi:hypothetical protein